MLVYQIMTAAHHERQHLCRISLVVWAKERAAVHEELKPLHLAGDMRCDSLGHTAFHETYNLTETSITRIVRFQVVKATTVSSSYLMEQKSLEQCLSN